MISLDQLKKADDSFCVKSTTKIQGDISAICCVNSLQENGIIFIKNKKYYRQLFENPEQQIFNRTIGIVLEEGFLKEIDTKEVLNFLNQFRFYATVKSVDLAFSLCSKLFYDELSSPKKDVVDGRKNGLVSIHPSSFVAEDVFLGEGVVIAAQAKVHAGCVILANSKIGERSVLYPNVVIYGNVTIGQDCIIHANTTIGSDGFRFNFHQGKHLKVWHFGGVIIEDSVEIGSNSSVDQGTFSPTVIGRGSKIDNQVHIAHNCHLGKGVIICGQSGLAGSVTLGDYVVLGGAVNVAPGIEIGDRAQVGGMSGVTSNIPSEAIYGGHPARPLKEWLKAIAYLRKTSLNKTKNNESLINS